MSKASDFVNYLLSLMHSDDKKALATLKRLRETPYVPGHYKPGATRLLWRFTEGDPEASAFQKDMRFLVALAFAWYPHRGVHYGNFGTTYRAVMKDLKSGPSVEARFDKILSEKFTASLFHYVFSFVSLARAREVPINWFRLLEDLENWHDPMRSVQRAWQKEAFVFTPKPKNDNEIAAEAAV